jgi:hypothetical protein
MHRSSESIAALAAALAKAQSELSNPEKSLIATIGADRPGEGARSFRYAPLSSGLDIVRKALGQQQIATVQTTAIDASTGTVNLTTILAHASGEWIASDWPVCRLADTVAPHRMGAALTYARRYSLFTLVGIAGEDDLDAPDLNGRPQLGSAANAPASPEPAGPAKSRRPSANGKETTWPILGPGTSAALCDQLMREIPALGTAEDAAQWARSALAAKNSLTASDARLLGLAFGFTCQPSKPNRIGGRRARHRQGRATRRLMPRNRSVQSPPSLASPAAPARVPPSFWSTPLASTRACCRSERRAGTGTRRTSSS